MSKWHRRNRRRLKLYKRAYRNIIEHGDYTLMRRYRRRYCIDIMENLIKKFKLAYEILNTCN